MADKYITFKVTLPTDNDFLGRECNNVDCKRYFKVHSSSLKDKMFCPYCSKEFSNSELLTSDQAKYIKKVAKGKAEKIGHKMLDKMMMDFANKNRGNKFLKVTYKPSNYRAKPVFPNYTEQKVDSELTCPNCSFRFQVFGIFGYCPGCRNENLLIYDANFEILKREIQNANDINRVLRHSYSDLVSTFETFCKKKAKDITPEATRFQSLFDTRKFYNDILGVNIFKDLDEKELLVLRRIFQKRHLNEHSGGVVNEKYIQMIPEDASLVNQPVTMSLEEFESGAAILKKVLDVLTTAVETKKKAP